MIKIQSIVLAPDLKKSIASLPADGEEELRFRAVRGNLDGQKEESGGIFIGPKMLKSFAKEKGRFSNSHLFDGTVMRSQHEPGRRLVLVTRGRPRPLLELVRACLLQAKLKYKVVVLGPGQKEPLEVGEEGSEQDGSGEQDSGPGETGSPSSVQLTQQRLQSVEGDRFLSQAFPKGEAAKLKKQTSRLIGGSGENFSPVLTALAMMEDSRSPANLADLESAARAYLKHAQKDYSERDRRDPVNQLKMATAEKILRDLDTARSLTAPSPQPSSNPPSTDGEWQQRHGPVRERLERLRLAQGQPEIKDMDALCGEAEQAAMAGDLGRALSILNGVEKLIEPAEHYEQERLKVAQTLGKLSSRLPKDQLAPLALRYRDALGHGHVGEFEQARQVLQDVVELEKQLLQRIATEEKDQQAPDPQGSGTEDQGWPRRSALVLERLERLERLGTLEGGTLGQEIRRRHEAAGLAASEGDMGRALSLLGAVERLLDEAENPPPKKDPVESYALLMKAYETTVKRLGESKIPEDKLGPLKKLGDKARELALAGQHEQAIDLLQRAQELPKPLVQTVLWEKKAKESLHAYTLPDSILKQGGQGSAYLLDCPNSDMPELLLKTGRSMEQEAQAYLQMGSHPNIARSLGMAKIGDTEGLLMEAIRGGEIGSVAKSLRKRMKDKEITHEEYWSVVQYTLRRVLDGLRHVEDLGLVHMDIKPDNVLFDSSGEVKIIDMGLVAKSGEGGSGTPGFQAPESTRMENGTGVSTSKADVFSVGAVLFSFGENIQEFRYNQSQQPGRDSAGKYLEGQALRQGDSVVNPKTGERSMKVGTFGAETEYTKFVNWLLDPDPGKRPSLQEALDHPFLKDQLLDDDQVKDLVKGSNLSLPLLSVANSWPRIRQPLIDRGLTETLADEFANLATPFSAALLDARREYVGKRNEFAAPTGKKAMLDEEDERLQSELDRLSRADVDRQQQIEQRLEEIEQLQEQHEEQCNEVLGEIEERHLKHLLEALGPLLELVLNLERDATEPNVKRFWERWAVNLDEYQLGQIINGWLK